MAISEKKMRIVINNYFKTECDVNTSIRQAFEKGFRIGVKKGLSAQPERKKGKWTIYDRHTIPYQYICSECGAYHRARYDFCPNCGARMEDGE